MSYNSVITVVTNDVELLNAQCKDVIQVEMYKFKYSGSIINQTVEMDNNCRYEITAGPEAPKASFETAIPETAEPPRLLTDKQWWS